MRRRLVAVVGCAVVLVAIVVAALAVLWHPPARPSANGSAAPVAASVLPGSGATATPPLPANATGRSGVQATSTPAGIPPPYVQTFAQQSVAPPTTPYPIPTGAVSVAPNIDGCDHDYRGMAGACVPWTFPAGVTDRCGWLRARGFPPLTVTGTDRLGLDANHDGVACGTGD